MSPDASVPASDGRPGILPLGSAGPAPGAINWIGVGALYAREVNRFLKVWMQTLVSPVLSSLLFLMVFRLAFPGRPPVDGVPFADFLVPGVVMMAVLNNAFQNTSSSISIAKLQGNTTDFLTAPLSPGELCVGFIAGAMTRGLLVGAVTMAGIAVFTDSGVAVRHWPALLCFSLTASLLMAAAGLMGGIWAQKFDHLAAVTNFVIMPLSMLSGTFYPVSALDKSFRYLLEFNPFFYLIDGLRFAMTGKAESDLVVGALTTGALALALVAGSWAMFRTGYRMKT